MRACFVRARRWHSVNGMTSRVLLAFADDTQDQARAIGAQLSALGYRVDALSAKRKPARTDKVVMVWSRAAWGTPALRAAVQRARAAGKLVCVSTEGAPPPLGTRVAKLPRGRAQRKELSKLLRPRRAAVEPAQAAARVRPAPKQRRAVRKMVRVETIEMPAKPTSSRTFAVLFALTIAAFVGAGVAYTRAPAFAAQIDAGANAVYVKASELAALAP